MAFAVFMDAYLINFALTHFDIVVMTIWKQKKDKTILSNNYVPLVTGYGKVVAFQTLLLKPIAQEGASLTYKDQCTS